MPRPAKSRKAAWEDMMKQSIFQATVTVMKEHGPAGIRMDRVARAAEMATGTLYNYFKDKEALLLHVIETVFEPIHENLLSIRDSHMSPKDKLEEYFRLTFNDFDEQREVITILIRAKDFWAARDKSSSSPEMNCRLAIMGIISEILEEGIACGLFRRCSTVHAATMIMGMVISTMEAKIIGLFPEGSVEEDVERCMDMVMSGIRDPSRGGT